MGIGPGYSPPQTMSTDYLNSLLFLVSLNPNLFSNLHSATTNHNFLSGATATFAAPLYLYLVSLFATAFLLLTPCTYLLLL
jgi:hypothetical protein